MAQLSPLFAHDLATIAPGGAAVHFPTLDEGDYALPSPADDGNGLLLFEPTLATDSTFFNLTSPLKFAFDYAPAAGYRDRSSSMSSASSDSLPGTPPSVSPHSPNVALPEGELDELDDLLQSLLLRAPAMKALELPEDDVYYPGEDDVDYDEDVEDAGDPRTGLRVWHGEQLAQHGGEDYEMAVDDCDDGMLDARTPRVGEFGLQPLVAPIA
ncbi:hypothetical protein K488DRAFT_92430 [Vararia minispora EC-137]|uniref:Uncharacterized protein n=1 Tax=Vararia minispora EC-137 TaxID=1314806 RepID=A0ACB8Q4C8_9AGAM|nr:hypothetical protein K488DRAFT_92430 [Vararia minispora EC-137]